MTTTDEPHEEHGNEREDERERHDIDHVRATIATAMTACIGGLASLALLRDLGVSTRELALAGTKFEEALLWLRRHEEVNGL